MHRTKVTTRVWQHLLSLREAALRPRATTPPPHDLPWSEDEQAALALYEPVARPTGGICTLAQIGQSLDGRIAAFDDEAREVSGPDGLKHLHRLRALTDAVVIGVNTALHDKPRLTVRLVAGQSPARVVIDPGGRLPNCAPVLADDGVRRIVIQSGDTQRPEGVEVIRLPRAHWISPIAIVAALHARGLRSLLIEGGGITIARFLETGVLNRLHVAVAPVLIGAGPQGLTTRPLNRLADAPRPVTAVYGLGSDVLFDCAFDATAATTRARAEPEAGAEPGAAPQVKAVSSSRA